MREKVKGGMEHVTIRTDRDDPSPGELKGYFAEVFADLDANPRRLMVAVDVHNDRGALASIAFEDGEPVFRREDRRDARADFRGRWLAEHPVPLRFPEYGRLKLVLEPTTGNRVKVRNATLWERIFR